MRAFVFILLAIATYAAPQDGYNYHVHVDSSLGNDFTPDQYQFLQQYVNQVQQLQHVEPVKQVHPLQQSILEAPAVAANSQTVTQGNHNEASGYHFASQLVQTEQAAQSVQPQVQEVQTAHEISPAPQQQPQEEIQSHFQHQEPQSHEARHQVIPQQREQTVQYNKEFYYLSAPQEDFDQSQNSNDQLDNIRKNIRVVFIRAPENNNVANAALKLAKQSLDQQTIVYVLTKQHDASDLANKLHQIRAGSHSKPDVMFVKYRTPEEAAHAQRVIQAQYESLDGPNHFNHEGVAPTHNFVGSAGHQSNSVNVDPRQSSKNVNVESPSTKYLPAAAKL